MLDKLINPVMRFLEERRMRTELKRLRMSGELDQILRDADYEVAGAAQGEWYKVYRKGSKPDVPVGLFESPREDEVIWWIVQRHRRETGRAI